jgi:hypothetical protein
MGSTASGDESANLWCAALGECLARVNCAVFSPDEQQVLTASVTGLPSCVALPLES